MSGKITLPRLLTTALIGDVAMWYDYAVYAELIAVWVQLFFPKSLDYWTTTMGVFAIFASGFVMRVVGSILLGVLGDKVGRKFALMFSIMLLFISSLGIAILPTYNTVGIWAPIMLTLMRLIQGIGLGGESGNAVFLLESSPYKRRAFISSFQVLSAVIGIFISNMAIKTLYAVLGADVFMDIGWRIAYGIGVLISFIGFVARIFIPESDEYQDFRCSQDKGMTSFQLIKAVCGKYRPNVLIAVGIDSFEEVALYTFVVFFGSIISDFGDYKGMLSMFLVIATLSVAFISDYVDRVKLMALGGLMLLFGTYFVVHCLLNCASSLYIWSSLLFFVLIVAITIAPVNLVMLELFPVEIRYTGFALSRNVAAALFGGMAPLISAHLIRLTSSDIGSSLYPIISALIGLISLMFVKKRLSATHV